MTVMNNTQRYEESLVLLEFFNKLDNSSDYTSELNTIRMWDIDKQREVADKCIDRADEYATNADKYLKPIYELGMIDQRYLQDLTWAMQYGNVIPIDNAMAANKIRDIATQPSYEKSVNEGYFWQRIASIAIGTRDSSVLPPVITKIESVKDRF